MKSNLVIIGFEKQFNKDLCLYLADKLDMFFVDVAELIEYNLINSKEALLRCGREYIEKEEKKTVRNVADYENTIINIPYDIFINNKDFFNSGCYKIFIIPQNLEDVDKIVMADRIELIKSYCNAIIENVENNVEDVYNKIINSLKGENR